ncbi:MAG: penicillin-binding transpeptidase domain-containing protein, partial [Planctomycetota bacterium]|nr:penicillin-binding transpeptidase domain-containing protein [Planctomycetota bacterium]
MRAWVLLCLALVGCRSIGSTDALDWEELFEAHGATGAFSAVELDTGAWHRSDRGRCTERALPASTFKVFHFMAALETGAVASSEEVVPWDRVLRGGAWDQAHDLRSALAVSAVWVYEETARRIGRGRFEELLQRERYGNRQTGGERVTFWLHGDLAISPDEQVQFLRRLWKRELGFAREAQDEVLAAMITRSVGSNVRHEKTGWSLRPEHGWLIGIDVRGERALAFALLARPAVEDFDMRAARPALVEAALAAIGWDEE